MKRIVLMIGLLVIVLGLAACGSADVPEVGATCPSAGEGTEAYTNESYGYCFLYPAGYMVTSFEDGSIRVEQAPASFPHPMPPFASVEVTAASSGFTPEDAADDLMAGVPESFPGFEVSRSDVTVGGEQGLMLDQLPGQDVNRQVLLMNNGLFYRLTFYSADPSAPEYQQMLTLYDTMVNSFTFTSPAS